MATAPRSKKTHPGLRDIALALLTGLVGGSLIGGSIACAPEARDPEAVEAEILGSLLAVGDTGESWGAMPWLFEGQLAVGSAMQRAHADAPADALILLGDNFYPEGLLEEELVPRIVENVARPYCAFVAPSAELAAELAGRCPPLAAPPPPLLALIGNHDLMSPGSVGLQRDVVPRFVLNWEVPIGDGPILREMPGGISLIFLVSESPWGRPEARELAAVLRRARGRWRIVVGHRPPIAGHPGLSQMVALASKRSGRPVHAYLAGHVHALGAIRGEGSAPALTVIAGSGSHAELQESTEYRVEGADLLRESLGFVRVDSLRRDGEDRLRISLFEVRASAALAFLGPRSVVRYEIETDGRVEGSQQ